MNGKTILFCGSKGGCGASFISYTVASYLALKKEQNILLLDLAVGSYSSRVAFDLQEKETKDLGDIKRRSKEIDTTLLRNLVINTESTLNLILPPLDQGKDFLKQLDLAVFLDKASMHFDVIVVDLPLWMLNRLECELLKEMERMVIVSSPSLVSITNLNLILSKIGQSQLGLDTDLVINKYNLRPSISPSIINSYVNHPIKAFIPYDKDIDFLFLNKGPASIFKYNLRITSSLASFSDSLYEDIGYV